MWKIVHIAIFTFLTEMILAIQLKKMEVPRHAIRGQNVHLRCSFSLGSDVLYSVKWYRDDKEFYRYVPSTSPKTTIFKRKGINIDAFESTKTDILLKTVDLSTSGEYKCEISAEGPLFQTAFLKKILSVVDLPDGGPLIDGALPRYHIGDTVSLNCTSLRSKPAAFLQWFINGEPADQSFLQHYPVWTDSNTGLESRRLGLKFKIRRNHFKDLSASAVSIISSNNRQLAPSLGLMLGNLNLKCTASILDLYWMSNEESVQGVASLKVSEIRKNKGLNKDFTYVNTEIGIYQNRNAASLSTYGAFSISFILQELVYLFFAYFRF